MYFEGQKLQFRGLRSKQFQERRLRNSSPTLTIFISGFLQQRVGKETDRKGGGIPSELFQILKDGAVKVLHSICQQIWKTHQWSQDWKRSVIIPIPKKGNAKECSNYHTIALIRRQWHPTPVLLSGKSHGRRSLVGCNPWGC